MSPPGHPEVGLLPEGPEGPEGSEGPEGPEGPVGPVGHRGVQQASRARNHKKLNAPTETPGVITASGNFAMADHGCRRGERVELAVRRPRNQQLWKLPRRQQGVQPVRAGALIIYGTTVSMACGNHRERVTWEQTRRLRR